MAVYGIVSEYNPFHNGHKYQIDEILKNGDCDGIVAVMSGNYVQRSECAIMSKYDRARAALQNGIDLVVELPLPYAVSSAERFAFSAVSILDSLGVVNKLSFGSECGDIELLNSAVDALSDNTTDKKIGEIIKRGICFPTARSEAVCQLHGDKVASILKEPNNILAVEYIKALKKLNSTIIPETVKRNGSSHDSDEVFGNIASASKIRRMIYDNKDISDFLPLSSVEVYNNAVKNNSAPSDMNKIGTAVLASLKLKSQKDFVNIPDVSEGIENRILDAAKTAGSLNELYDSAKIKRFTHSRIRRIVLCSYLGISNDFVNLAPPYIRVLGFTSKGKDILRSARKTSTLPVVMTVSDVRKAGTVSERYFELECKSTDIFNLTLPKIRQSGTDMTDNLVRIE